MGANIRDMSQEIHMSKQRAAERISDNAPMSGAYPTYGSSIRPRGNIPNNVLFSAGISQGTDRSDHPLAPDTPDQGTQVFQTLFSITSSDGLSSANQAVISAPSLTLHRQQIDSSSYTPVISANTPLLELSITPSIVTV